jgi:hypothetical protein
MSSREIEADATSGDSDTSRRSSGHRHPEGSETRKNAPCQTHFSSGREIDVAETRGRRRGDPRYVIAPSCIDPRPRIPVVCGSILRRRIHHQVVESANNRCRTQCTSPAHNVELRVRIREHTDSRFEIGAPESSAIIQRWDASKYISHSVLPSFQITSTGIN